jgi:cyclopropane fatty-acyl-phospholipid synthase-like methyltransferase
MVHVIDRERPDLGGNMRHGDILTWTPLLWTFLIHRYGVQSMLDVGCGEGHSVLFFHRNGVRAHGIDGLRTNVLRAVTPIALHDILTGPYFMPVDLVWSCEVAEHIDPAKVDNYLDTLANGRVIAMTHALPGQGGHHHVNCQPKEYWIEHITRRGYVLSEDNERIIEISKKDLTWNYFSKSGMIFIRQ